MKEIPGKEIRDIQLSILNAFDDYCRNNELTYFLGYGTLLGAVRHKGYIPWDDDIDVIMPRVDYDKLVGSFNNCNNDMLKILDYKETEGYYLPYAKMIRTDTVVKESVDSPFKLGINIDIFPLDSMGKSIKQARLILRLSYTINWLISMKNFKFHYNFKKPKHILLYIFKSILRLVPYTSMFKLLDIIATISSKNDYVGVLVGVLKKDNSRIFKPYWFDSSIQLEFESRFYPAPKGYIELLSTVYGDYMTLPPEKERITHHSFKAWYK